MTYRRAVIPALVGSLLVTLLLWWAGASVQALQLPGSSGVFGIETVNELRRWLAPWAYDPPAGPLSGGSADAGAGTQYTDLYRTAMHVRFVAVFAFYLAGALLLIRRLPPAQRRTPATLLALWAWGPVAGTLAATVSAPWLIASGGRGSFRVLPQLANVIASSGPVVVFAALLAALLTVAVARITAKGADLPPRPGVPPRAARLAASAGTAVIALSLVALSYEAVAAWLQTSFGGGGMLSEPGDLLRQWLLLGGWSGPGNTPLGDWLLYRLTDVLVLGVVWWGLRLLPGLLTRVTVPGMAVGTVCVTVLGLLAGQLLNTVMDGTVGVWGPAHLFSKLGAGVPAALTFGVIAGVVAFVTLRLAGGREVTRRSGEGAGRR
ncbi:MULTISPECIES: hypothetical protein [Streptomyces]|uniref:hypothetical protein n=1 Tax=Streptomyces TaxID=1883 RepID=UPI0004CD3CF3|nr:MULTISPECIES: hypothetical protein [Streptomyces]KOT60324.1 membrane protein [Streptomyces rimosus subsp. rimosus]